jgi:FXSXX-COOH protein
MSERAQLEGVSTSADQSYRRMTVGGTRGRLPSRAALEDDRMGDHDPEIPHPAVTVGDAARAIDCDILEVGAIDLDRLAVARDSALVLALRRVLVAAENPGEGVSTFQQSI